jgi:hypothetical protein
MIEQDIVDAYSNKMAANLNDIRRMSTVQLDRVKATGSAAENLLVNREFVLFVRQHQLEIMDVLAEIKGHTLEDNNLRVALSNQLSGIEGFINLLKRAKYMKNRVVTQQQGAEEPDTVQ